MRNRFKNISKHFEEIKNKSFFSEKNIKRSVYFLDKKYVKDLLFFSICLNNKIEISKIKKLIGFINNFKIPKFPISGDELKNKYGYESGELLGKKLKDLEKKWIENNFFIDDKEVEKSLNKFN
jgi:tRNA nucleotidyltransferase/poly(A) polymerase